VTSLHSQYQYITANGRVVFESIGGKPVATFRHTNRATGPLTDTQIDLKLLFVVSAATRTNGQASRMVQSEVYEKESQLEGRKLLGFLSRCILLFGGLS